MKRLLAISALLAALAAALLLLREREVPSVLVVAPAPSAPLGVEEMLEVELPVIAPLTQPSPRAAQPPPEPAPAELASPIPEAAAPHIALDQLLRLPGPPPTPTGPQSLERATAKAPATADDPKQPRRVQVELSSEEPLAEAPLPRDWRRSEAGVTVRVDEADRVRLRGGVRVDERGETETNREVEASPSVGVEVRF